MPTIDSNFFKSMTKRIKTNRASIVDPEVVDEVESIADVILLALSLLLLPSLLPSSLLLPPFLPLQRKHVLHTTAPSLLTVSLTVTSRSLSLTELTDKYVDTEEAGV
jgi:hypothetical protein